MLFQNWNETLNQNKAGAADNAEDFTKQFMKDMFSGFGPGLGTLPPGEKFKPQVAPVGQMPSAPSKPGQTFTKTSLAANKQVCLLKVYNCEFEICTIV